MIQKVEKWRIQELEQVLNRLASLLLKGENSDWASVFSHFALEAKRLAMRDKLKLDSLKRLVYNIFNCFDGTSSIRTLVLAQENAKQMDTLNQDFREAISHLFDIFASIEEKWTDRVN
jgi:hypothetical protein